MIRIACPDVFQITAGRRKVDMDAEGNRLITWLWAVIVSALISVYSLYLVSENWYEIKGSYFSDTDLFSCVNGTIRHSETGVGQESEGSTSIRTSRTSVPKTYYFPIVTYTFNADGVAYTSDKIAFADIRFGNKDDAKRYLSKFPTGGTVRVYYDPDDPRVSILDVSRKGSYANNLLGVLLFPLVLLALLIRGFFKSRQREAGATGEEKLDTVVAEEEHEGSSL